MNDKITAKTSVDVSELTAILGLSANRIYQLTKDGILARVERGRYLLCDAVQGYLNYRTAGLDGPSQEAAKLKAEVRLKKAKAEKAVLETKELKGRMHRSEDVAAMTEDLIYAFRNALTALPGRLAVEVAAAKTPAQAADIIRRETCDMMRELSSYQYDPQKYQDRVRERLDWETLQEESEHDE